jgi:uncharacterized protein (DUF1015 family)
MPEINAFDSYLVAPSHAESIVTPAYDSVSPEQRRQFADANPDNFINTMRLPEDFSEEVRPTYEQLLTANRNHLQKLLHNGAFTRTPGPSLFIYQLGTQQHLQTGLVCEVSVDDYKNGALKKHENTHSVKEDLLARYQEVVGAASSPICVTYAQDHEIDAYLTGLMQHTPNLDFITDDGEVQRVWQITDSGVQKDIQQLFAKVNATYVTDGHHRAASGLRYAELMRAREKQPDERAPYNQLLVALFPDNQLNLLPFHRCVRDLNGHNVESLLTELSQRFNVTRLEGGDIHEPAAHGEFGMWLDNRWYQLNRKPSDGQSNNPVDSLDVTILQNDIFHPILGITDVRGDNRLGYIAGVSGDAGIDQCCREGWQLIFTCHATSIEQLMAVADAHALMPPKSTYFDPKPRSGIFVRLK